MNFGEYLRSIRIKKMSQRELARRIGVNHSYISKIENNIEQPPSEEIIINIAKELNVDADKLIIAANKVPRSFESIITNNPLISELLSIIKEKEIDSDIWEKIKNIVNELEDSKKSKVALVESEKKYEIIFNNANDAIFLNELDNNGMITKIIDANYTACKKLGYTKEELLSKRPIELIDKYFLMSNPEVLQKISDCQKFGKEMVCTTKTGSKIIFDINSHCFKLFDKKVILTIARDISYKKHLYEAHNVFFEQLFKSIPQGIAVLDKEFKVYHANDSFQKMFGYSLKDIKGQDIREFICMKDKGYKECCFCNELQQGQCEYEKNVVKKRSDGTEMYLNMKGNSIKYKDTLVGINIIFSYK